MIDTKDMIWIDPENTVPSVGFEFFPMPTVGFVRKGDPRYGEPDPVFFTTTAEGALEIFGKALPGSLVLCVDLPRAELCGCYARAHAFFDRGKEPEAE